MNVICYASQSDHLSMEGFAFCLYAGIDLRLYLRRNQRQAIPGSPNQMHIELGIGFAHVEPPELTVLVRAGGLRAFVAAASAARPNLGISPARPKEHQVPSRIDLSTPTGSD